MVVKFYGRFQFLFRDMRLIPRSMLVLEIFCYQKLYKHNSGPTHVCARAHMRGRSYSGLILSKRLAWNYIPLSLQYASTGHPVILLQLYLSFLLFVAPPTLVNVIQHSPFPLDGDFYVSSMVLISLEKWWMVTYFNFVVSLNSCVSLIRMGKPGRWLAAPVSLWRYEHKIEVHLSYSPPFYPFQWNRKCNHS